MTQFPADDALYMDTAPRTSGLAIASLVCSLICCIPGVSAIGVLLGLIALATIREAKGKGLAITGIVLGVLFTIGWVFFITVAYGAYKNMVQTGDKDVPAAIIAAQGGDADTFRALFVGDGATASDDDVQAFVDAFNAQLGAFQGSQIDWNSQAGGGGFNETVPLPLIGDFANAKGVIITIEIQPAEPPQWSDLQWKVLKITIEDPDDPATPITFPPDP